MNKKILGMVLWASLLVIGCAHQQAEKTVDQKVQESPAVTSSSEISAKVELEIKAAKHLTPSQKDQLLTLNQRVKSELESVRDESLKLRELLITDVIAENYNADEVAVVKDRLKKMEDKRITVVFNAVDEANTIMGRSNPEKYKVLKSFDEMMIRMR